MFHDFQFPIFLSCLELLLFASLSSMQLRHTYCIEGAFIFSELAHDSVIDQLARKLNLFMVDLRNNNTINSPFSTISGIEGFILRLIVLTITLKLL